jgi:ABC-2 type transport system ATP-binding protein
MFCLREVTKRYDGTVALDRLSLQVPAGTGEQGGVVFGLLGPNGAGKTTVLRLVMGFIFPNSGEVDRGRLTTAEIGYLPERAFYPPRFAVRDYLLTSGRLAGLQSGALQETVDHLLARFGLGQAARKKLGACSRGMLQRVGLAQALLGDPPLLLLDEPTSGLDPAGQKFMREQMLSLQEAGKTVLLSSHHLDEVTRVCNHIAVISQGRLVRSGPLEAVLAPRSEVSILTAPLPPDLLAKLPWHSPEMAVAEGHITLTGPAVAHKAEILRLLLDNDVDIQHLSERRATLEEIYLEATGE